MVDTVVTTLTDAFSKIFDGTTDVGKSFTIQNNTLVDIVFLEKSSTPATAEKGLILGVGKAGAVLDVSEDIYFRAINSRGAALTSSERV